MNIKFNQINQTRIRNLFIEVLTEYEELHDSIIELKRSKLKSSTMQAQPIIRLNPFKLSTNHYRITLAKHVRDNPDHKVNDLPDKVLKGWFAHELGHILDYKGRSALNMIVYALKYLISSDFKRQSEHTADLIAIRHGFGRDIKSVKNYLTRMWVKNSSYQKKLNKYYMSVADVERHIDEYHQSMPVFRN